MALSHSIDTINNCRGHRKGSGIASGEDLAGRNMIKGMATLNVGDGTEVETVNGSGGLCIGRIWLIMPLHVAELGNEALLGIIQALMV